jgi:hypothetical protein
MSLGSRFEARQEETLHTIEKEESARYCPCYIVFPFPASRSVGTWRECPTRQHVISTSRTSACRFCVGTFRHQQYRRSSSRSLLSVQQGRMQDDENENKKPKRQREHGRNCIHRPHSHAQRRWSHCCVLGPLPLDAARSRACYVVESRISPLHGSRLGHFN